MAVLTLEPKGSILVVVGSSDLTKDIPARLVAGVAELLSAHEYALNLHCDAWEFAVEITTLYDKGLSNADIRWLILRGSLNHAHETTTATCEHRQFEPAGSLLTERSCVVLTECGIEFARNLLDDRHALSPSTHITRDHEPSSRGSSSMNGHRPKWDQERGELRLAGQLVKLFRWPAPNQQLVLSAFEEEAWPERIDDPLVPAGDTEPRERLRDTVRSLNRHQRAKLIDFVCDTDGVRWSLHEV